MTKRSPLPAAGQPTSRLADRLHDLKNPVAAILANCQYLAVYGTLCAADREVMDDIASSARALGRMLDEGVAQAPAAPRRRRSIERDRRKLGRGSSEQVPLKQVTTDLRQDVALRRSLHPLGDDLHAEVAAHPDEGSDQ